MKQKIDDLKVLLKQEQAQRAAELTLHKEGVKCGAFYNNLKRQYEALQERQADYDKLKEFKDTYAERVKQYYEELNAALESEKMEVKNRKKAENDYDVLFRDNHILKDEL